jgi:predicted nucleotidyltransferase
MYELFQKDLLENRFFKHRKENSELIINNLKDEMRDVFIKYKISIFTVGSIGRHEFGNNSDLDIFLISKKEISKIMQYEIYAKLIEINRKLKFPEFSNDGQFLTIHQLSDLKKFTGSPDDDSLNLFTTRMLMILESKVLFNENLYNEILSDIIEHYLRDRSKVSTSFKPLFLLNDILRFWRTLCLNYEAIRNDSNKPWRKKNINLKYSRMLTVFSTIIIIIIKKDINQDDILDIFLKTPLERIAWSLDQLDDDAIMDKFNNLLEYYQIFLEAKENTNIENDSSKQKELNINAEKFSNIIYDILNHHKIDNNLKKFLTI